MSNEWDTVVVGSGVGGLVCACYLAAAGLRVLVLEQHDVAGGNAHVFRRRRAYEFDVGVHYLGDCGDDGILPAILGGLGLRDRVRFLEMDRDGFDRIVLPSVTLDVPKGWARYRERLAAALPGEAAGIAAFTGIAESVADLVRRNLLDPLSPAELIRRRADDVRWSRRTLTQLFDHCGLSDRARTLVAAQSGNYGSAPSRTSVATHAAMLDHYMRGAYYPQGGGQALVAALVEALEAHGGELRTRCRVARVPTSGGRARGVLLDDGRLISAPLVVSNADYLRTVLELCDAFPERAVERARAATMRLPMAVLYVGLNAELPPLPNANVWAWPREDIERLYQELYAGRFDTVPFAFLSFASGKEPVPSACPPGHGNFQVMTLCPPRYAGWGTTAGERYRRNAAYLMAKRRLTEQLIAMAERLIGPFQRDIAHLELATPLTHERYVLSSGGSPYGLERWGTLTARPDVRSDVEGLYLAGQNTKYGGGIAGAALSGIACAGQILGRPGLLGEVHGGVTLADPARLPHREPGWDALQVSRGRARRDARGLARIG
ncbi:NAD(P)/FAD-dependent oxidoreductase [Nonomuraea sp. B12E4]|uniref:phytoene desaturase family protein n=1 Tax=Nonomuraea sp. B12E4 TaxID=3153564 RepID=UPI00325DA8F8